MNPTKEYLSRALQSTPNTPGMAEVRTAMRVALSKLERVEKKEHRKSVDVVTPAQKWNEKIVAAIVAGKPVSLADAQKQLAGIDKMLETQTEEIENSKKGKNVTKMGTILD
jgi:hypothetical protein